MKSLFARIVVAFLVSQMIFIGILVLIFFLGYERSLSLWQEERTARVMDFAQTILLSGTAEPDALPPVTTPFFVFNLRKELVYSNRGGGFMRRMMDNPPLLPVHDSDRPIGYISLPQMSFADDAANTAFLQAMRTVIVLDIVFTSLAGLVLSYFFSRSLSKPARMLAVRLDRMADGDLVSPVPVQGPAEIGSIARSAERLGRELAAEKETRGRFSADIAHDLRTPISAMRAQFEGMRDGILDLSPARIEKSLAELGRIEELVTSLEELMKLEAPEFKVEKTEIAIDALFRELTERFQAGIEKKNIRVRIDPRIGTVRADAALLFRALSNLMANAVRHADEGGEIALAASNEGRQACLSVSNSGKPIPPDELAHVFDRLFRGEYARHTPGSGLGLTIAKQIAELHGGTIGIESSESFGTRVTVYLPL